MGKQREADDLFAAMRDVFIGGHGPKTKRARAAPTMTKRAKALPKKETPKPTAKALRKGLDKSVDRVSTEGEIRRDEAMDRVEAHATPEWKAEAARIIRKVAMTKPFFTTADIWEAGLSMPHEPRALGPMMTNAERDGICNATREYRATNRPSRHCAPVRVWRSLLIATDHGKAAAS